MKKIELNALLSGLLVRNEEGNYSFSTEAGNGVDVSFVFSFVGIDKAYIRESDVHVFVRDSDELSPTYNEFTELIEDFEFPQPNTITLQTVVPTPLDGSNNIMIRRIMPKDAPYADASTDAVFRREVLNRSFEQQLYVSHEALDGFIGITDELREAIEGINERLFYTLNHPVEENVVEEMQVAPLIEVRKNAFFLWDDDGGITSVKITDFLEFIGGELVIAGQGLYEIQDTPSTISLNIGTGLGIIVNEASIATDLGDGLLHVGNAITVGAGTGIDVLPDSIALDAPTQLTLENAEFSNVGDLAPLAGSDLNLDIRSGMFYRAAGALNNPNSEDGMLIVTGGTAGNTAQMFFDIDATLGALNCYYRSQRNGTWSAWDVFITTENVLQILSAAFITFVDDGISTPQHTNVQDGLEAALTAIGTRFNPATNALTATNVQEAIEQIVSVIEFITSGVQFEGTWDANLNLPPINTYTPINGGFYLVAIAGSTDLSNPVGTPDPAGDPLNSWEIADVVIYDAVAGDNGYVGWNRRPDVGRITNASGVVFDPVNYIANFPAEIDPNPPLTSQQAHDKVWGFARNTLESGVGIQSGRAPMANFNELRAASFEVSTVLTVGHPAQTGEKLSVISGLSDVQGSFGVMGIEFGGGSARAYYNTVVAGVLGEWTEAYLLTAPMTKAYVDEVITNADAGNIGKTYLESTIADLDALTKNGMYSYNSNTPTAPTVNNGVVWHISGALLNRDAQIARETGNVVLFHRHKNGAEWQPWQQAFSSDTRTSAEANVILDNADYGAIGKYPASYGDMNLLPVDVSIFANCSYQALNKPLGGNFGGVLQLSTGIPDNMMQVGMGSSGNSLQLRSKDLGAWTAWQEVFASSTRTSAQANAILNNYENGYSQASAIGTIVDYDSFLPVSQEFMRWGYSGIGNTPNTNRANVLAWLETTEAGGFGGQLQFTQGGGLFLRNLAAGVWSPWSKIVTANDTASLPYLPLTGGDLQATAGGLTLGLKRPLDAQSLYIMFKDEANANQLYLGLNAGLNGGALLQCYTGDFKITSVGGDIDLTAPVTNVNGQTRLYDYLNQYPTDATSNTIHYFLNELGAERGRVMALVSGAMQLSSSQSDVNLQASNGTITLNAPFTRISGIATFTQAAPESLFPAVNAFDLMRKGEVESLVNATQDTTGAGTGLSWWRSGATNKVDMFSNVVISVVAGGSVLVTLPFGIDIARCSVNTTVQDEGDPAGHTDAWNVQAVVESATTIRFYNSDGSSIRFHWQLMSFAV